MTTTTCVRPQDWSKVLEAYRESAPYHYVVIDDFLETEACEVLRRALLEHWGWRFKNWVSAHLHNNRPDLEAFEDIAANLKANLPKLLDDTEFVSHWALMYAKNVPGRVHADIAGITLTLWLTPDEYNLDPETGGLILFDVKRPPEMMPHEHLVATSAEEFVSANTKGGTIRIPYRCNRAVLFDGSTFHKTDTLNFAASGPDSHRINAALAFENRESFEERMRPYQVDADQRTSRGRTER